MADSETANSSIALTALGTRILVWGSSCAGKSTLAEHLSQQLDLAYVDLDALNWLPNWVGLNATDPARLERRMDRSTTGDRWVVAGSYTQQSQATFWPRLNTIVWLDFPLRLLLKRVLVRSWQRWRSNELLWGTNREKFWDQLKLWRKEDSLIWWIISHYHKKRSDTFAYIADPRWAKIQFIRLRTPQELDIWLAKLNLDPINLKAVHPPKNHESDR